MMKKGICMAVFLVGWMASAQNTFNYKKDYQAVVERTKKPDDKLFYESQLSRFTANDATLTDYEVLALLVGLSARDQYKPLKDGFKETILDELNSQKNYADASRMADKAIKQNPLSIKAIYGKSYSLLKLQQTDSAGYYAKQWQKILKAMFLSGRGMTIDDPIFSLGPDDGQEFVTIFAGAQIVAKRTEKNSEGESIKIYEATIDKKKLIFHFMIDPAVKRIEEERHSR